MKAFVAIVPHRQKLEVANNWDAGRISRYDQRYELDV
jgi:hypothetical protein